MWSFISQTHAKNLRRVIGVVPLIVIVFFQGENWTLELSRANPEHKKMKEERKRLTFTVPRDRFGHVKSHSQFSHLSRVVLVSWSTTLERACGA